MTLSATLSAQQAERYTVTGSDVAIYNLAGEIRVEAGAGPGIVAEVTRSGADAAKLKVMKSEIDGTQTLRFVYPADRITYGKLSSGSSTQLRVREDGTFSDRHDDEEHRNEGRRVSISGASGGLNAHADLRITVPMGKQLSLYLAVGKVAVSNVEGDLNIDAASAPVTTSNTRGELNIDVGSGQVQVSNSRGGLSVDTGSGQVSGSELSARSINVDTGSGDIKLTAVTCPELALETGSGSISTDLRGPVRDLSLETGSGDISVRAPATLAGEVEIETASGEIETDFPIQVTRHARDHVVGRIGDGLGRVAIETGSGDVRLLKSAN